MSTQEVDGTGARPNVSSVDFIAAETMWNAILASVPEDALSSPGTEVALQPEQLALLTGRYKVGPNATLTVGTADGRVTAALEGSRFFDLEAAPAVLHASSEHDFYVVSRYGTRLSFLTDPTGRASSVIVNPGRWAEQGERIPE